MSESTIPQIESRNRHDQHTNHQKQKQTTTTSQHPHTWGSIMTALIVILGLIIAACSVWCAIFCIADLARTPVACEQPRQLWIVPTEQSSCELTSQRVYDWDADGAA